MVVYDPFVFADPFAFTVIVYGLNVISSCTYVV
jgi:hypothetical protein